MKTDIYSHYLNNQNQLGFWIKKNNWKNYLARIVKIRGISEGDLIRKSTQPPVIALLLDIRTNELQECVEINCPEDPSYIKIDRVLEPKNILPPKIYDLALNLF